MLYVLSRYNHNIAWVSGYTDDVVIYDRSEQPLPNTIVVPNVGSDIYDKFSFIIDNYDNLPDIALYSKANLFDYIKPREFETIKDNTTFTPLLTQDHKTYEPICWYEDGIYCEINNYFYLNSHPVKNEQSFIELRDLLTFTNREYLQFCPGSNYILTREDILKHPKELYEKLRSYLIWSVYPGEAQMIERGLYYLWGTDIMVGI